jgi:predicted MFS family arabinose efflux permease
VLATAEVVTLVLFTVSMHLMWPLVLSFLLLFIAGATSPNIGSLVRARWVAQVGGTQELGPAFAWEAVVDELVFIAGPPLVTFVALQVNPVAGIVLCAALVLVGAMALALQRNTQPEPRPQSGPRPNEALFSGPFLMVLIVLSLLGGVFGAFEITTVATLAALGSASLTGLILALYAGGSLIAGLVVGTRQSSLDPGTRTVWLTALLAVACVPLVLADDVWSTAVGAVIAGAAVAPILIHATTQVERIAPRHRITEALGISISAITIGVAVASPATGALVDVTTAATGYQIMLGCGVGMLVAALVGRGSLSARHSASGTGKRAGGRSANDG